MHGAGRGTLPIAAERARAVAAADAASGVGRARRAVRAAVALLAAHALVVHADEFVERDRVAGVGQPPVVDVVLDAVEDAEALLVVLVADALHDLGEPRLARVPLGQALVLPHRVAAAKVAAPRLLKPLRTEFMTD